MLTRYPGLSSFTTAQKDIFFGRKQETRDLSNLLSVERTVVLFSKSGYGKTSLLQAGVMPLLFSSQIVPVPIRFGTDALTPEQHFSIQFDTAWLKFSGKSEQDAQKQASDTSLKETFWEQIRRCPFGEGQQKFTPLLIFDQFEELFTLYPDKEKRARFVSELANLVQERLPENLSQKLYDRLERGEMTDSEVAAWETPPPMKFIFSIRSDMLHFMDELSEPMPYILRSRYQLFGLGEEQAREAIVAPAALGFSEAVTSSHHLTKPAFTSQPFGYKEESLQEILAVLSKNKEVESFQLQAVCQAIEEKIMHGQKQKFDPISLLPKEQGLPLITPDFYGGREGIDRILEDSYNRRLDELANIDETWPEIAHRLIEDGLVNKNGRRKSVDVVELLAKHRATPSMLEELESQRLVRKEPRLDSFYYEISHDTWLGPILKNKKIWEEAEEKRLLEAKAEAERVEKEIAIAKQRRARVIAGVGFLLAGLAVTAAMFAWRQTREAERLTVRAQLALKRMEETYVIAKILDAKKYEGNRELQFPELIGNTSLFDVILHVKNLKVLSLNGMNLSKLPENLGELKELDKLDLSDNKFNSLSNEIGKFQNLKSLDLSGNELIQLPEGIGNLQNLQFLNLIANKIQILPPEIGNLQNLQRLDLDKNNISSLTVKIGNLESLKLLNLYGNRLTSLPVEIGNLQNLQSLNLGDNQLASLPAEIGNLPNLESLNLGDNQLTSLPAEIGKLQNLQSLDLGGNKLTSLPIEALKKMRNLKTLILNDYRSANLLPKEQIEALRTAMPWCEVWGEK